VKSGDGVVLYVMERLSWMVSR